MNLCSGAEGLAWTLLFVNAMEMVSTAAWTGTQLAEPHALVSLCAHACGNRPVSRPPTVPCVRNSPAFKLLCTNELRQTTQEHCLMYHYEGHHPPARSRQMPSLTLTLRVLGAGRMLLNRRERRQIRLSKVLQFWKTQRW